MKLHEDYWDNIGVILVFFEACNRGLREKRDGSQEKLELEVRLSLAHCINHNNEDSKDCKLCMI